MRSPGADGVNRCVRLRHNAAPPGHESDGRKVTFGEAGVVRHPMHGGGVVDAASEPDSTQGSAKVTMLLPEGAPFLPPPQTMTTYCLPLMV
jgi:hypothetical protein